MNYLLFIIFLLASFAMADDGSLGVVRILNTQPVKYSIKTGGIIPDSQHTILKIKDIVYDDEMPGKVALVSDSGNKYDALLVIFDKVDKRNFYPQVFGHYLYKNKGFEINVIEDDLEFDTSTFLSILKIEANDIVIKKPGQAKATYLKNAICPMRMATDFIPWTQDVQVRVECL